MTLRPEGTAGVVRSYLENGMASLPSPVRLFYISLPSATKKCRRAAIENFTSSVVRFSVRRTDRGRRACQLARFIFPRAGPEGNQPADQQYRCPVCRAEYNQKLKNYLAPHLNDLCETSSPDMTEILCASSTARSRAATYSS